MQNLICLTFISQILISWVNFYILWLNIMVSFDLKIKIYVENLGRYTIINDYFKIFFQILKNDHLSRMSHSSPVFEFWSSFFLLFAIFLKNLYLCLNIISKRLISLFFNKMSNFMSYIFHIAMFVLTFV